MSNIPRTISDFRGECRESGDQLNYKDCPVCGSTAWKVFVDRTKGKWVCFGGRHPSPPRGGYPGGNLKIEGSDDAPGAHILELLKAEDSVLEWGEMDLPDWEPLGNVAKLYLARRGIMENFRTALGLVEWTDKHRILIPYLDEAGQLIYYTSRRYSEQLGEGPKYLTAPGKHPLYFLGGITFEQTGKVVIVEGCFDAMKVSLAGYDAIALGGKSLPRYLESLLIKFLLIKLLTDVHKCGIIYLLLDRDAMPQALRIRNLLTSKPGIKDVQIRLCPHGMDPGDMTPDQIRRILT